MKHPLLICLLLAEVATLSGCEAARTTTTSIYRLADGETVFAYARISPDGRYLAYTSEPDGGKARPVRRLVCVVDLTNSERIFSEPGIDPYWSPDGSKLIFVSDTGSRNLAIWNRKTGTVVRDVALRALGDYPSWGKVNGRDVIVTVAGNYYFLSNDKAEMPYHELSRCPETGAGARPLISKSSGLITVFSEGVIAVRDLMSCDHTLVTNIGGAKADFSYDERYIAFHAPKQSEDGYDIHVVDLLTREDILVSNLPGSSLFPSWTDGGALVFRFENGADRGFVRAEGFLANRRRPLPKAKPLMTELSWETIFPHAKPPRSRLALVVVWANWGAHSAEALTEATKAAAAFRAAGADVSIFSAVEPASALDSATKLMRSLSVDFGILELPMHTLPLTWANNQIPAVLLFKNGKLVARRLGAQGASQLVELATRISN